MIENISDFDLARGRLLPPKMNVRCKFWSWSEKICKFLHITSFFHSLCAVWIKVTSWGIRWELRVTRRQSTLSRVSMLNCMIPPATFRRGMVSWNVAYWCSLRRLPTASVRGKENAKFLGNRQPDYKECMGRVLGPGVYGSCPGA